MVSIVLLDANFLYVPFQFNIDIFKEISRIVEGNIAIIIPSEVHTEIKKKINREKGKLEEKLGKAVLSLVDAKEKEKIIQIVEFSRKSRETVDDYIIRMAFEIKNYEKKFKGKKIDDVFVATNDKMVKLKANKKNIKVIHVRKKKILDFF
ncbi:MAG: PIN domain-containing protein [Promethearchaeota archaeon]